MSAVLHVESVGHGPPLVLLHGWAMHGGVFGPLLPRLARRFRVHAVDLPGHGRSSAPPMFSVAGTLAALDATFAGEAQPLRVLGWSLGGLVALAWALAAPARIARLALVCTSPRFVAGPDWPHAMSAATLARFGDELHVAWKPTVQRFLTLQVLGSEHGRAALAALRERLDDGPAPSPRTLAQSFAVIADADLRAAVGAVRQPALVVAGTRDTLAPPGAGEWLAAAMPDARYLALHGAAHAPFLSHPEPFDAAVLEFLDAG